MIPYIPFRRKSHCAALKILLERGESARLRQVRSLRSRLPLQGSGLQGAYLQRLLLHVL
jgi:hypothetical protein